MSDRVEVLKTYKLYIGGAFPRTESGRYYKAENKKGEVLGNICLASRKDFRNAVVAAEKAQSAWAARPAYNIAQIIYRIGENLESRKNDFAHLIAKEESISQNKALTKVEANIDRIIYFAGWADKFQQLFSNVNPVASSHFNFSMIEQIGVVVVICHKGAFEALLSSVLATITSGNSLVVLSEENAPLSAITFAEILQHSDLPAGVVNILTGNTKELYSHFASHKGVKAFLGIGLENEMEKEIQQIASDNLKRLRFYSLEKLKRENFENPYVIKDFTEVKTTWHPIEQIGGAATNY